jgi:mono/diheme cytochrome c family protein
MIVKRLAARRTPARKGMQSNSVQSGKNSSAGRWKRRGSGFFFPSLILATLALFATCDVESRKSDAELGLTPQQSVGRKIYDAHCDRCHEPYSTKGKKGPGLKGVFKNKYLSLSGLPANDERVTDIIRLGRNEMPAYTQTLSPQDIQDLLAYLHTL